jgi:hypothetical protein
VTHADLIDQAADDQVKVMFVTFFGNMAGCGGKTDEEMERFAAFKRGLELLERCRQLAKTLTPASVSQVAQKGKVG